MLVSVIYRPPKIAFKGGSDFIENLQASCLEYQTKIIMGDLNANLLSDGDDSKFVRKLVDELSLRLVEHGPTHYTLTSQTWIDVMLVDSEIQILDYNNEEPSWPSKHRFIDVRVGLKVPETTRGVNFQYRDYKSINATELTDLLQTYDWSSFQTVNNTQLDVDKALEQLCNNLSTSIERLAPLKRVKSKKYEEPWTDDELRVVFRKRDALYRRYVRTGNSIFHQEYLRLRDLAIVKSDEARSVYYKSRITKALQSNSIWKELRSLGLLSKPQVELNGFSPEELNKHFAGVSVSSNRHNPSTADVIREASEDGFRFSQIGWSDVILAIKHFSSQAVGEDGIPQSVVAKALPVICPFLVSLFNSSLNRGIFPSLWKRSNIIPLKKCSAPASCSDFRPISILCFLSKVLEKLVHGQLTDYLVRSHILDPLQTGFRANHSTQTALIKLTDDIRLGMDRKLITFLVQFDFSKAFDTVSPALLLRKLSNIGLSRSVLRWVDSYLADRRQSVISRTEGNSSYMEVDLGVPQGSVLGPLLFCIYINDICQCFGDSRVRHLLYADDLQIYVQVRRDEASLARELFEGAAKSVSEWALGARLRLNTAKTRAAIFGTPRFTEEVLASGFVGVEMPDGVRIPFSETVESLGVILDSRLSWKPHITNLSKKFNRVLYCLRSFRQYTTENLRKRLAMALLFPLLDYCSVVLLDASLEQQSRLQVMQNACTRYVFGLKMSDSVTSHRVKLGWLRVASRRNYFLAVLMYKVLRLRQPSYLSELFHRLDTARPVRGETKELKPMKASTGFGRGSFQVQGAIMWNALPARIRHLPSLSRFKSAVKLHLQALD